jgi:hypothetical protein
MTDDATLAVAESLHGNVQSRDNYETLATVCSAAYEFSLERRATAARKLVAAGHAIPFAASGDGP